MQYTLEVFDSRNTSQLRPLHHASSRYEAQFYAKKLSRENEYKVILHGQKLRSPSVWTEYENGKAVAWSYPIGV